MQKTLLRREVIVAELYLMLTGGTTWEDQERVESAAGAPLSERGVEHVQQVAGELADKGIAAIYASSGEAERQTADIIARRLGLKVKHQDLLREIDYGLWQGLTIEQIKSRQPSRYRQWTLSPESACPPGGETLSEAEERLRRAMEKILHRRKDAVLVVLRPVMLGLARSLLRGRGAQELWKHVEAAFRWERYETNGTVFQPRPAGLRR